MSAGHHRGAGDATMTPAGGTTEGTSITTTSSTAAPDAVLTEPVHFIGLGGAGMSAVARVLLGRGLRVSGDRKSVV